MCFPPQAEERAAPAVPFQYYNVSPEVPLSLSVYRLLLVHGRERDDQGQGLRLTAADQLFQLRWLFLLATIASS